MSNVCSTVNRGDDDNMQYDLILVGGGLQSGLLALAVLDRRPGAAVALVERAGALGGEHTWSFHAEDVPAAARSFVERLVVRRWPAYSVAFPGATRVVGAPYASTTSARLDEVVRERLDASPASECLCGVEAIAVDAHAVTLADGRRLEAKLVIDARGPSIDPVDRAEAGPVAYQKFVGQELELAEPSPLTVPRLIDACVPQTDGFRFFYVLPLDERRVLVEDTYFADGPALDVPALRGEIARYAASLGVKVRAVIREEVGVLPLPLERMPRASAGSPLVAGYRGGFFHPTTGYSFPAALRVALHVAERDPGAVFDDAWTALMAEHARQARFGLLLNRLLFRTMPPDERWRVLARFYTLPEATIRRFYAMTTTTLDRARIVCGRPPQGIALGRAFAEMLS